MLFENKPIFEIRYPTMEEDFMPPLRLCAILDCTQQVGALANAFRSNELSIDLADPDDDIPAHFEKHRPDILMLDPDVLSEKYMAKLTKELQDREVMPKLLVTVGFKPEKVRFIKNEYLNHLHISAPVYPPRDAEFLERIFVTRLLSKDFYRFKLEQAVEITLKAMHCREKSAGFEYLKFAVVKVLSNPYVFFGSTQAMSRMIAEQYDVTPVNITSVLNNTISKAVFKMTGAEYNAAFEMYEIDGTPSIAIFVFAAARLAARPLKKVLYNMLDEPFEYPQRKMRII